MASHKTQKALKSVQSFLSSTSALGNFSEPRWCAGLARLSHTSLSLEPFCSVNNSDVPLPKVTTVRPYASSSRHKEHLYFSEQSVATPLRRGQGPGRNFVYVRGSTVEEDRVLLGQLLHCLSASDLYFLPGFGTPEQDSMNISPAGTAL